MQEVLLFIGDIYFLLLTTLFLLDSCYLSGVPCQSVVRQLSDASRCLPDARLDICQLPSDIFQTNAAYVSQMSGGAFDRHVTIV